MATIKKTMHKQAGDTVKRLRIVIGKAGGRRADAIRAAAAVVTH